MNKSALLGFVFGVIIIAFLAGGYYLASGIDKMNTAAIQGSEGTPPPYAGQARPEAGYQASARDQSSRR